MVDIENDYFDKDGLVEDAVDELIIAYGGDDENDDDEDSMIDDDDRQLMDDALRQFTEPTDVCTNPRRDLTDTLQNMDRLFRQCANPNMNRFPTHQALIPLDRTSLSK